MKFCEVIKQIFLLSTVNILEYYCTVYSVGLSLC